MKNRLEIKILLLIIVVLVIGFGTYVIVSISSQTDAMIEQHHEKAQLYGEAVMVGIRNVMLSGKGSYARALVSDARDHFEFGNMKVFDREANEVYPEEGKGIIKFAGEKNVCHHTSE
jgi:lipopolysaccharide export system protein LptC